MIRDNYLDIRKIFKGRKIMRLFRAVEAHGGALRFVGGCVRDALMGREVFDIDLATDLSPDELVEACEENGLKTVPIGIKFGTVGVMIDDTPVEVTSLRKDIKSEDGRHPVVEFTDNWEVDASRRDLTINAVYADEKGNVFDYYDGIKDLEQGIVRFIGNPDQRIKEDYLRILRFFRFYSLFSKTPVDSKALKACIDNKDGLARLSAERIREELYKFLETPKAAEIVKIMIDNGIWSSILPKPDYLDKLDFLVQMTEKTQLSNKFLRRLFAMYYPNKEMALNLATRLKMSKKQKEIFIGFTEVKATVADFTEERKRRELVYRYGKEFARDKFLLQMAYDGNVVPDYMKIIQEIMEMAVPVFPIKGRDLIALGVADSKLIGSTLNRLEEKWIKSGFMMSREELLEIATGDK